MLCTHDTVLFGPRRFSKFLQQLQQVWPKYSDEVGPNSAMGKGCRVSHRILAIFSTQDQSWQWACRKSKVFFVCGGFEGAFVKMYPCFLRPWLMKFCPRIGMRPATTVMRLSTTSWFSLRKDGAPWLKPILCQHLVESHWVGEVTNLAYMRYIMLNHQTKKMSMSKIDRWLQN